MIRVAIALVALVFPLASLAQELRPPLTAEKSSKSFVRWYFVKKLDDVFNYTGKDRELAAEALGTQYLRTKATHSSIQGGYQWIVTWEKCPERLPTCTERPQ